MLQTARDSADEVSRWLLFVPSALLIYLLVAGTAFGATSPKSAFSDTGLGQAANEVRRYESFAMEQLRDAQTLEFKQFEFLMRSDRQIMSDEYRNMLLEREGFPENERSLEAIKTGGARYLQRCWARHWEARRRAAAEADDLGVAWSGFAADEARLFGAAQKRDIDPQSVRPPAQTSDALLTQLNERSPVPPREASRLLCRGLLLGPPDERLARAVISYADWASRLQVVNAKGSLMRFPWDTVCQSPDPLVIGGVVDLLCTTSSEEDAEAVLRCLFRQIGREGHEVMTAEMVSRLLSKAPRRALTRSLSQGMSGIGQKLPGLREAFLAPDTPSELRSAMVGALIDDPVAIRQVFDTLKDKPDQQLIEITLRRLARPAGVLHLPEGIDLAQIARDERLSFSIRKLAIQAMSGLAHRVGESGKPTRESLRSLASDPRQPLDLQAEAMQVLSASEDLVRRQQEWRQRTPVMQDEDKKLEEERKTLQDLLDKGERNGIPLTEEARAAARFWLARNAHIAMGRSAAHLRDAFQDYAGRHDGHLPPDLKALKMETGFEVPVEVLYFPVSRELDEISSDVILAIVELPPYIISGDIAVIAAVCGKGVVRQPSWYIFSEVWERSNIARRAAGLPDIEPQRLGKLARYLAPPQTQRTQPSPTTRPGGATQPSNAPRPASQPRLRR